MHLQFLSACHRSSRFWGTTLEDRFPCFLETFQEIQSQPDRGPAESTQWLPPAVGAWTAFQQGLSTGWGAGSHSQLHALLLWAPPPLQAEGLLQKSCAVIIPQRCLWYNPINSSIETNYTPLYYSPYYYSELCPSRWILHNPITQKTRFPPVTWLCFSRPPHLPLFNISAHASSTQHSLCLHPE